MEAARIKLSNEKEFAAVEKQMQSFGKGNDMEAGGDKSGNYPPLTKISNKIFITK